MIKGLRITHFAASIGFIVVAVCTSPRVDTLRAQGSPQSVWSGIYTDAQAKRGEVLYAEECASCHGAALTGGEMAPALAGGDFNSNWNDLSLGDLLERIRVSMPQNSPGKLSRQQCADVLAHMLSVGKFPAGAMELTAKLEVLKEIKFLSQKP